MLEDLCEPAISIKLNHSQDGQDSDLHSSHAKDKHNFKVKCFACYSTNNPYCKQCQGSEMINNTHPLALLLNDVLNRKLNLGRVESREQQKRVYPIKEEEQPEDRKLSCGCEQRQCKCYNNQMGNSLINFRVIQVDKMCHNCNSKIENCYSICKTCQKKHIKFWICDTCSDNNSYNHPQNHVFQAVIDYDDEKIDTVSQEIQQEEEQGQGWREQEQFNNLLQQPLLLDKKNSSIANYLQECTVYHFNELSPKPQQPSRVKFELDGLFSSFDINNTKKDLDSSIKINKKQSPSSICIPSRHSKQNISNDKTYAFVDYKCDYCQMQPIIDVRYHCKICEDFDLCDKCYEESDTLHEHDDFQKIDLRLYRQKAVQRIFQKKDTNLKSTSAFHTPYRKAKRNKTLHFNQ